jgi:formylmethanofuran dehydrogenase subunit E
MSVDLSELLRRSSVRHDHLCPRQVLGVRMGLAGMAAFRWPAPISKDSGLVIIETDGCFADGMEVATGAAIGHRTLRVNDLGKIAATFADLRSGTALRIAPRQQVRMRACDYAPSESRRYFAQLEGYQRMPAEELFCLQAVSLDPPAADLASLPTARAICQQCGEEISNQREVLVERVVLCRQCAGAGYYVVESNAEELFQVRNPALD